jgi:DNA-binding XRE family transcriptional regulator
MEEDMLSGANKIIKSLGSEPPTPRSLILRKDDQEQLIHDLEEVLIDYKNRRGRPRKSAPIGLVRPTRSSDPRMRILEIRAQQGLTQAEFCAKYDIEIGTLQNWEQGRRKPNAAVIRLIEMLTQKTSTLEDA